MQTIPEDVSPRGAAVAPAVDAAFVARSFSVPAVVDRYVVAAKEVSLWEAEREMMTRHVRLGARVLDLGCGAGRTTIGLRALGYRVHGVDISRAMVDAARGLAASLACDAEFTVADARRLPFADASFDAALFSFNGFMQIPGARNRLDALVELRRVLRRGGTFVFTTPERESRSPRSRAFWDQQEALWAQGRQNPRLLEFGDVLVREPPDTLTYLRFPTLDEVRGLLARAGLALVEVRNRRDVARESEALERVLGFMECHFWVATA